VPINSAVSMDPSNVTTPVWVVGPCVVYVSKTEIFCKLPSIFGTTTKLSRFHPFTGHEGP